MAILEPYFIVVIILILQELQDECITLKGVDTKNTSLQSHIANLQKELEKCKVQINKVQEKNDHLEKKIIKVIKCVCSIRVQV